MNANYLSDQFLHVFSLMNGQRINLNVKSKNNILQNGLSHGSKNGRIVLDTWSEIKYDQIIKNDRRLDISIYADNESYKKNNLCQFRKNIFIKMYDRSY